MNTGSIVSDNVVRTPIWSNFWHAFASRGFVSDSWAFLFCEDGLNQMLGYSWILINFATAIVVGYCNRPILQSYNIYSTSYCASTSSRWEANARHDVCCWWVSIGPFGSKLSDRFGCRAVTMSGALLLCVGLVFCSVSTQLFHVYLALGILAGIETLHIVLHTGWAKKYV